MELPNEIELKKFKNIYDRIQNESQYCPFCRDKLLNVDLDNIVCENNCQNIMKEYGVLSNIVNKLDDELIKAFDKLNDQMICVYSFNATYMIKDSKGSSERLELLDYDKEYLYNFVFDGDSGYFGFKPHFAERNDSSHFTRRIKGFETKEKLKVLNAIPEFIKQINDKLFFRIEKTFKAFSKISRINAMFKVLENTKSITDETVQFMNFLTTWKKNHWYISEDEIKGDVL